LLGVSPGLVTILGALLPANLSLSKFETVVPFAIAGPDPLPLDLPASVAFEFSRLLSLSEPLRKLLMVDRGVFGSEGVSFDAAADVGGRLGGFLESRGKRA